MTETKRLFIGLTNDNEIIPQVFSNLREDFKNVLYGKWVEKQNLHITIKFLGDTEVELIPQLQNALKSILGTHQGKIVAKGINAFPSLNRPRILYIANTVGSEMITSINKQVETSLAPFFLKSDNKTFRPHLTICRIKEIANGNFSSTLAKYRDFDFGSSDNYSVNLYESKLTPRGPIYSVLSH